MTRHDNNYIISIKIKMVNRCLHKMTEKETRTMKKETNERLKIAHLLFSDRMDAYNYRRDGRQFEYIRWCHYQYHIDCGGSIDWNDNDKVRPKSASKSQPHIRVNTAQIIPYKMEIYGSQTRCKSI